MLNRLFKSLDVLLRRRNSLNAKASQLAQTERRLMDKLSGTLARAGYRVVPLTDESPAGQRSGAKPVVRKRLRCPECDRTFAHPLPMARHVKATHHPNKAARKTAKPAGKKRARKKAA